MRTRNDQSPVLLLLVLLLLIVKPCRTLRHCEASRGSVTTRQSPFITAARQAPSLRFLNLALTRALDRNKKTITSTRTSKSTIHIPALHSTGQTRLPLPVAVQPKSKLPGNVSFGTSLCVKEKYIELKKYSFVFLYSLFVSHTSRRVASTTREYFNQVPSHTIHLFLYLTNFITGVYITSFSPLTLNK